MIFSTFGGYLKDFVTKASLQKGYLITFYTFFERFQLSINEKIRSFTKITYKMLKKKQNPFLCLLIWSQCEVFLKQNTASFSSKMHIF